MKIIETEDATASLAEYAAHIESGPVVVTCQGRPVAVLASIENTDLETLALAGNHQFIELIENSRARTKADGGISSQEMRRRFD